MAVLGHVDSGKTSLLDKIRGTSVQERESGGITQHIGASFLPNNIIQKRCGHLYEKLGKIKHQIPGILVIDTPGHEVFKNLRTRGGSAADIAILVVDVNRGFQPQTNESLQILQNRKVPFVVALNKTDQLSGWRKSNTAFITEAIKEQDTFIQKELDQKIYDVVGTLSILGYESEAFYRVTDYTKEIAIVPVSARTGVGIPELLAVLTGLAQKYLVQKLDQKEKPARGIVLEVNDEVGLGSTANIILIDGFMSKDDTILVAKRDTVLVTKLKAILLPKPLDEMRDPRDKFLSVDYVNAAAGIKITASDLDDVLPGSTVFVAKNLSEIETLKKTIESEMRSVFITTETDGVIVKCDTIGSLEAVVSMLQDRHIPIAKADIGPISKRDVIDAKAVKENNRHLGVVIAFNVKTLPDAQNEADKYHIKMFNDNVIYNLLDMYTSWVEEDTANQEDSIFKELTPIAKFTFLKGFVFRNKDPAVFGIRVDAGILRQKTNFMNQKGKKIGQIHQLQKDQKTIESVKAGSEVACSVQNIIIGRHINEEDVFYTLPYSYEAKQLLQRFSYKLSSEELGILEYVVKIQRELDPAYGY